MFDNRLLDSLLPTNNNEGPCFCKLDEINASRHYGGNLIHNLGTQITAALQLR